MSLKKALEVLGYDLEDESKFDPADLKRHVDETFITREAALKDPDIKNKIVGKTLGSISVKAAGLFGLKNSEYDGKQLEEVLQMGYERLNGEITKLKDAAGKGTDEEVKRLKGELETKQTALLDLEKQLDAEKQGRVNDVTGLSTQLKQVKLRTIVDKTKSAIQFTDDYTKDELKQQGFDALISNKYQFDLNEHDEPVVLDKAGKPVKHPTVASKYASIEDVFKMEAESRGLLKKNNLPVTRTIEINSGDGSRKVDVTKVHPNALKHEKKLTGA